MPRNGPQSRNRSRNHSLWLNNLDTGTIVEVPIKRDGLPGRARLFAEGLGHPDGHQFDVQGNLWVANLGYQEWDEFDGSQVNILRVSPDGRVRVAIPTEDLSAIGLATPVFGFGRARSTLFISSAPLENEPDADVGRVNVGVKGMILPQFER